MTLDPQFTGALPKYFLAAVLFPTLSSFGQTIPNPSFEIDPLPPSPGYGAITGWTGSLTRTGLASGAPFADNGAVPAGTKVALIQASGGPTGLSTTITDLVPGTKYLLTFRANARNGNKPFVSLTTGGVTAPVVALIGAVGATPYRYMAFEFVAQTASQEITITNGRPSGDHTLLVDDFAITPSLGAWGFSPWTGDADSGVDSQFVYTHSYNFGTVTSPLINGVHFYGGEAGATGRFTLTGLTGIHPGGTAILSPNNVTGESGKLNEKFRFGGVANSIKLENLKPNTEYQFSIYGVGFDLAGGGDPHRSVTFSSSVPGSQQFTADLDQYGQGNGIRLHYTYTTDASGTPVIITYPEQGSGSFHTSGFSNRETTPRAIVAKWTAREWTNDQDSGISSSHAYTHAYNLAAAGDRNVNGIVFTGSVAPPNTPPFILGTNSTYTGDNNNNIAGFGAGLSTSFLYGASPTVSTLSGLEPGKAYVLTIYSTGWEAPGGRLNGFFGHAGDDPVVLDQDQFGQNSGICFDYQYTAAPDGTARIMTSGAINADTRIHYCAITNRAADPLVDTPPSFTLQPAGAVIGVGSDYMLQTGVVGSPGTTYQWKLNNVVIPGATDYFLLLEDVDSGDTGNYTLTATNAYGNPTSDPATVTVLDNIPGFGTGVAGDGVALENGVIDPHFVLTTNPDGLATEVIVQSPIPGSWVANSPNSKWIGPRANTLGAAAGQYVYKTQMDLTGFTLDTVQITGKWATDNGGLAIRVNGVVVPGFTLAADSFLTLQPFTINLANTPGLIQGVNTIEFVVQNDDIGFTGLRVDSLSAVGSIPPNTPPHVAFHPASAALGHGEAYLLSVFASGSATLTYQWYFNGDVVPDATASSLMINASEPAIAGNYKVKVSNGTSFDDSDVAVITIPNAAPATEFDVLTADPAVALELFTSELLANDTDPDGDTLTVTAVSAASTGGGTVVLDGSVINYTSAPGFSGTDTFTYTVSDGIWGGISVETVVVNVGDGEYSAPTSFAVVITGGVVNGTFIGTPGQTYILQRSETLLPLSWTDVDTEVAPPSGNVSVQDPGPLPAVKAFYRIGYTP